MKQLSIEVNRTFEGALRFILFFEIGLQNMNQAGLFWILSNLLQ